MARFGFRKPPLWVKQGLQAILCLEVLGSADTSYASSKGTTGKQETFHWFDVYRWKENMTKAERRGIAPSTEAVLSRSNVNELIQVQRAKMYCLVDYFLTRKLPMFRDLLVAIAAGGWKRDGTGEYPALRAVGLTIAELLEPGLIFR